MTKIKICRMMLILTPKILYAMIIKSYLPALKAPRLALRQLLKSALVSNGPNVVLLSAPKTILNVALAKSLVLSAVRI